ncbi:MAG: ABC transporter ATP-binding protein [bacterium]
MSLEIERGEVFGLLGPNGAGKTTAVNMALGLLRPDAGAVELDVLGPPTRPEVRAKIGVAPQTLAIYEDLSGEENLSFFGKIQGMAGGRLKDRVDWCLEFVDLADRRGDRVKTYSGGMKRRLNLAIALIHDPPLLLLDEPTVGVDPQSRNAIFEKIEALREEGRTIVYTTHYMEEAQRLCRRVGILDRGKLLALDTVEGLIAAYGGKTSSWPRGRRAECELRQLLRFRVDRPDLEGVFLNLTGRHLRD